MAVNSFLTYPLSWKPDRETLTRPIYLSLARQLKEAIASGTLAPGTVCLPSGNWPGSWASISPR